MKLGETIGADIRKAREKAGWTQFELAQQSGSEPSYIGRLERGEIDNPGIDSVANVLASLGLSLDRYDRRNPVPK